MEADKTAANEDDNPSLPSWWGKAEGSRKRVDEEEVVMVMATTVNTRGEGGGRRALPTTCKEGGGSPRPQYRDRAADSPDASTPPRYDGAAGELALLELAELVAVNDCCNW